MGGVAQVSRKGPPRKVEIPFIYALLENEQEIAYKKLFDIVIERDQENNINVRLEWCQYNAVLEGAVRTNNISKGWDNRLQVVTAKDHTSFYYFLAKLQKEQADSEFMLRELNLEQK